MDNANDISKKLIKWLEEVESKDISNNDLNARRKAVSEIRMLQVAKLQNQIIKNGGDKGTKFFND